MTLEYLAFANLILLPRLIYLVNDGPLSRWQSVGVGLLQIILVMAVFKWTLALLGVVLTVVGISILAVTLQRKVILAKGYRILSLLGLLLIPGYFSSFGEGFVFTAEFSAVAAHLGSHLPLLADLNADSLGNLSSLLLGILLLANETNIGIRAAFHHLQLVPHEKENPEKIDEKEYNAGRVIGILERWLMFIVVVATDDLSALAFIIAAKGLARMKQLDDKQFAEYMLVGTLLSALSAVLVGFWVKQLLKTSLS